jgi:hypothetical protein
MHTSPNAQIILWKHEAATLVLGPIVNALAEISWMPSGGNLMERQQTCGALPAASSGVYRSDQDILDTPVILCLLKRRYVSTDVAVLWLLKH